MLFNKKLKKNTCTFFSAESSSSGVGNALSRRFAHRQFVTVSFTKRLNQFLLPFLWLLKMSFRFYSGGIIGLLIGLLEKDPCLSVRNHTIQNEERYFPWKMQDSPFPCHILSLLLLPCLHCIMTWTQISFVLHLQTSGRSNVSSSSTLSYALFWKEIITAHNSKQCVIYPDTAGFAVFMFKMCFKRSELSVTEII
jgi:hypothetical protein